MDASHEVKRQTSVNRNFAVSGFSVILKYMAYHFVKAGQRGGMQTEHGTAGEGGIQPLPCPPGS